MASWKLGNELGAPRSPAVSGTRYLHFIPPSAGFIFCRHSSALQAARYSGQKINCRSVAICLDNDFENSSPSDLILSSVAKLIKEKYPQVGLEKIVGHREVNPKTTCPGKEFLTGWKLKIINALK